MWSKDGYIKYSHADDPNMANLIYENQLKMEVIEYGNMLHKSLLHISAAMTDFELIISLKM